MLFIFPLFLKYEYFCWSSLYTNYLNSQSLINLDLKKFELIHELSQKSWKEVNKFKTFLYRFVKYQKDHKMF